MIQQFNNGIYRYFLSSPVLIVSKIKLNGVDILKYLSNQTKVAWYDVSKNSGRDTTNADGTMISNVKIRIFQVVIDTNIIFCCIKKQLTIVIEINN